MKKMSRAVSVYFPAAVLILTVVLFFWLWKEESGLNNVLRAKKEELMAARASSADLKKLEQRSEGFREEEKRLLRKIPLNDKQPLDLIKELIRAAGESGLKEIDFDLKEEKARSGGNLSGGRPESPGMGMGTMPGAQKPSSAAQPDGQPREVSLEMNCRGTFPQLLVFLKKTVELERVVTVEKADIEREKELIPSQKISLRLIAYTF